MTRIDPDYDVPMKASELLTKAAIYLERDHDSAFVHLGCCDALNKTWYEDNPTHGSYSDAVAYLQIMRPTTSHAGEYWYGEPCETPATQERVLALLFAAAIAESEGE